MMKLWFAVALCVGFTLPLVAQQKERDRLKQSYLVMEEILGMSDRIVVMREGRTTGELSRQEATAEAVMHLATLEHGSAA